MDKTSPGEASQPSGEISLPPRSFRPAEARPTAPVDYRFHRFRVCFVIAKPSFRWSAPAHVALNVGARPPLRVDPDGDLTTRRPRTHAVGNIEKPAAFPM
jgi:hypothetical protein